MKATALFPFPPFGDERMMRAKLLKRYLYLTSRSEMESDLIGAECFALTGAHPDDNGIAISSKEADVSRSAYTKSCIELICDAKDIEGIYQNVANLGLHADDFRISVTKIPKKLNLNSMEIAAEIAAHIGGFPDLSNPKVVFCVVATEHQLWFGKLLSENDRGWSKLAKKPHTTSASLPARLARAAVNLVAQPGDKLIDPCCGAGTLLLEAAQMGFKVVGYDINPKMVWATRKNLAYFGLEGLILHGDARKITGEFGVLVTDLPYGMNTQASEKLYREILQNTKSLARKAALVTAKDISGLLCELGYSVNQVLTASKYTFTRYIHLVST